MKTLTEKRDLDDMETMLLYKSHKIIRINKSGLTYVIQAQNACNTTYFVPCDLRPHWRQKYYRGAK